MKTAELAPSSMKGVKPRSVTIQDSRRKLKQKRKSCPAAAAAAAEENESNQEEKKTRPSSAHKPYSRPREKPKPNRPREESVNV
jgi:hypothetical protein